MHFLRIHGLDTWLANKMIQWIQYASSTNITRGEAAHILTRLLEQYRDVPIWYDTKLLQAIYEYTKDMTMTQRMSIMQEINIALKRVPDKMLNDYWLTKYRLLSDLDAIRQNKLPERKEKVSTSIDILWKRRQYKRDVENIINPLNVKHFNRDRYDELEF